MNKTNLKYIKIFKLIKSKSQNEKFVFIKRILQNNPNKFSITSLCNLFEIKRQSYYWWLKYKFSKKQNARSEYLQKLILKIYNYNEGVYGYERICKIINRDFDQNISPKCVYYRMKKLGIKSIIRVKTNRATELKNVKKGHKNLIKRNFKATKLNEKWFNDITYVQIKNQ